MEYSLKLCFLTADGQAVNMIIPRANPLVTGHEVLEAMNNMLDTGVIATKAGEPRFISMAEMISTEETVYGL